MAVFTFESRVENGQIRLPEDFMLPEHAKVDVVIPNSEGAWQPRVLSPRLRYPAQSVDFTKEVLEVRPDADR